MSISDDVIRDRCVSLLGASKGNALYDMGLKVPIDYRNEWFDRMLLAVEQQSSVSIQPLSIYRFKPVGVREFIESEFYLGKKNYVYPVVMDSLIEINSGLYEECLLTGSIGAAKSTIALYTQLYQVYLLSCMKNPHASFGLDPSSEIVIAFQSINFTIAKRGDYGRFKSMVEMSPYFKEHFTFDNKIDSRLLFPNRIEVLPISGLETAAIGQNILSAVIEEVNFMEIITKSKKSIDGADYDQASKLYNSISKRRESRFLTAGKLPGILCIVSSKRYPGQFTDTKEAEARKQIAETGRSKIYVYDKRMWDVKPESYSGVTFPLFIGDEGRQPRILDADEAVHPKDRNLVDHIPIELKHHFERDMITSLRDIAGRSTLASHPFILNTEAITNCMDRTDSIFSRDSVDFVSDSLEIYPENFYNPELPRYAHIDLGITGDSAGLVIGTITGFERVMRSEKESAEMLPKYYIDGALEVRPPKGGEILFYKIRDILYALRDNGLNIRWVSLDSFQCLSGDTQIWSDHGMVAAKDVTEGMIVQSRIGPRPVTKKWSFGVQPTIKMLTSDHSGLEMTEKHKIEVAVGWTYGKENPRKRAIWDWVEARNLKVGDVVRYWNTESEVDVPNLIELKVLPPKNKMDFHSNTYEVPSKITEDFAQLLGLIWGDGNIHKDGLFITCAVGEELCAAQVIKNVFSIEPSIRRVHNHYVVGLCSQIIVRWLTANDLIKNEDIPDKIKHSPKSVQAAFIRGLFSTDGSVSAKGGGSSFSTVNEKWAQYVHVFLRSAFGIQSCVVASKRTGVHYKTTNLYQFIVVVRGSRKKFYDTIGFCYKDKSEKLEQHLTKPGRELLLRITSLEKSEAEVFDFEVEEDHSYVANGYVSHNSRDTLQILRQKGFFVGMLSMDTSMLPYEVTKSALYDGRISMPYHDKLRRELASLEVDVQKGKVDHNSQGSKDCISGDTLIPLLNGSTKAIKDLVGEEFWVYSSLPNGRIVPSKARNVHKVNTLKVIKITLDSGDTLTCTPDHEIMLRDGTFIEAKDLKEGSSLMPFYTQLSVGNSKSSLNGYHKFLCNNLGKFVFTHQRVAEEIFNFSYGAVKGDRKVIHHKDFNKLNNSPSNFEIMGWSEHLKLHNTVGSTNLKKQWLEPEFRERNKERTAKIGAITGPRNLTKYNKSPERIAKLKATGQFVANGKKAGDIQKEKWKDPEYRIIQSAKMKLTNGYTRRDITLELIFETAKTSGSLEEVYEKLKCHQKVVMRVLDDAGVLSTEVQKLFDPTCRLARHNRRIDLTFDFLKIEATKYSGFCALCKGLGVTIKVIYARLTKEELAELHNYYDQSKRPKPKHFRQDVTFESLVSAANNKEKTLFEICTYLKIHSSVADRLITSKGYTKEQFKQEYCHLRFNNHKVGSIEYLEEPVEVYDMTVDETHNFAIAAGIFVHNCSDALSGVIFGSCSRREIWANFGISIMEIPESVKAISKDSKDTEKVEVHRPKFNDRLNYN